MIQFIAPEGFDICLEAEKKKNLYSQFLSAFLLFAV